MPGYEINVQFASDSKKIEVQIDPFTVIVDGGDRSEPSPGVLFISGVAACTASTARGYCRSNNLPLPTGLKVMAYVGEESHLIETVDMQLTISADFPKDRLDALIKAAGKCTVKKWWQNPPEFRVETAIV